MPISATIADVARAASVSPGTVSNVLNKPERVRSQTRARVQRAIDLLDYRPNRNARMLAGGTDKGIGLVVHDVGNPFFGSLANAVAETAEAQGFSVVMGSSGADDSRQESAVRLLLEHQLSGILLTPGVRPPRTFPEQSASSTPIVLLDYPGRAGQECSVSVDDVLGGRLAAGHLTDIGCRRLAFVGGPRRVRQHRDRVKGIRKVIDDTSGSAALVILSTAADNVTAGLAAAAEVASTLDTIDALICGNDLLAFGLIKGLADLGISVPNDVPVVGYDDIELAAFFSVPLTTIHQPINEMGVAATELLLAEITDPSHRHKRQRFKPSLVVRTSTATHRH